MNAPGKSRRRKLANCVVLVVALAVAGGCRDEAGTRGKRLSSQADTSRLGQRVLSDGVHGEGRAVPGIRTETVGGSGRTVWATGYEGVIAGLDGHLYEGYQPFTVEWTQEVLLERGLYAGPVNGVLDPPTMQAIYAFQDASLGLQRSGVPTPRTRLLLAQGSHTF